MRPLKSLVFLERLEIPVFLLLGWTPDCPRKNLRVVLPYNLRELCLRDDLVDWDTYQWTPWQSWGVGRGDTERLLKTCGPISVITQLRDYLLHRLDEDWEDHPASLLRNLCLKQEKRRLWAPIYLRMLEDICRETGVVGKIYQRMSDDIFGWTDEVKEIIIYDPIAPECEKLSQSSKYTCRYLSERSKVLHDHVR